MLVWCIYPTYKATAAKQQTHKVCFFLNRFVFIFFGQVLFSVTQWAEILSLLTWSPSYVILEVYGIKCHLKPFSCVHFETLKLPLYTGSYTYSQINGDSVMKFKTKATAVCSFVEFSHGIFSSSRITFIYFSFQDGGLACYPRCQLVCLFFWVYFVFKLFFWLSRSCSVEFLTRRGPAKFNESSNLLSTIVVTFHHIWWSREPLRCLQPGSAFGPVQQWGYSWESNPGLWRNYGVRGEDAELERSAGRGRDGTNRAFHFNLMGNARSLPTRWKKRWQR